jgi:flavin-dependent dehydrogenase
MIRHDAIVIGAGPAGSTAARLLARAGWSVAIVEKAPFPRRKVCGEFISAGALSLLARTGAAEGVIAQGGPEIREIGVYAGRHMATAPMPKADGAPAYGRAIGRDRLDAALLDAARDAGAVVYQPWRAERCERNEGLHVCTIAAARGHNATLAAPIVIAAHGSWDTGRLRLPGANERARPSDLLAFKARFTRAALAAGRMPLVAFPGGYGGLVESDGGRVSFSCCIRRDALAACRAALPGGSAGAAVLAHAMKACRGLREALEGAVCEEQWLAAGPLRPGLREPAHDGSFAVGNAFGEAHPIVAEGISMAVQSACLLCARLTAAPPAELSYRDIAREYQAAYREAFTARMRAAAFFAAVAMRPASAAAAAGMLAALPGAIALGARFAGKARSFGTDVA